MSYDSDYPSVYRVEFDSGRTIYISQYDVQEVKEYCSSAYENERIVAIYKEIYVAEELEDA